MHNATWVQSFIQCCVVHRSLPKLLTNNRWHLYGLTYVKPDTLSGKWATFISNTNKIMNMHHAHKLIQLHMCEVQSVHISKWYPSEADKSIVSLAFWMSDRTASLKRTTSVAPETIWHPNYSSLEGESLLVAKPPKKTRVPLSTLSAFLERWQNVSFPSQPWVERQSLSNKSL